MLTCLQLAEGWITPEEVGVFQRRDKPLLLTNHIIQRPERHAPRTRLLLSPSRLTGEITWHTVSSASSSMRSWRLHSDHIDTFCLHPAQTSCAGEVLKHAHRVRGVSTVRPIRSVGFRWRRSYTAGPVSSERSYLHVFPVGDQSAARQLESNQRLLEPRCVSGMLHSRLPCCHDNSAHCWELIGCVARCSETVNVCVFLLRHTHTHKSAVKCNTKMIGQFKITQWSMMGNFCCFRSEAADMFLSFLSFIERFDASKHNDWRKTLFTFV